MKIIILGSSGMLGRSLISECKTRNIEHLGLSNTNSDINFNLLDDYKTQKHITSFKPDIIFNCVAITDLLLCEENKEIAYLTNSRLVNVISNICIRNNIKLVHISTDHYYTGDKRFKHHEEDNVTLLNEYALTKYAGECFALNNLESLVIRTNIVGFRNRGNNTFVEWIISNLKNKNKFTLFNDYYTSSIHVKQLSNILFNLLDKNAKGLFNISSSEVFTKKEFIESLANNLNLNLNNTKTGSVNEINSKIIRAESLGLNTSKAENLLGYKLPNLLEVIKSIKDEYEEILK